jgi:hypothetical protein
MRVDADNIADKQTTQTAKRSLSSGLRRVSTVERFQLQGTDGTIRTIMAMNVNKKQTID